MITEEMRGYLKTELMIDYDSFAEQFPTQVEPDDLIDEWIETYQLLCAQAVSILSISLHNYTFLWDEVYERVVAVYGVSEYEAPIRRRKREKSRIAYYYRNFVKRHGNESLMDTGHFIAHSLGGGLDMNLFPQKREVNRGHSPEGKLYRSMEDYGVKNPGTFTFSRPIYFDDTWRPYFLEYGVVLKEKRFWVHTFDNV